MLRHERREPSRLIFVRHLDTPSSSLRRQIVHDERFQRYLTLLKNKKIDTTTTSTMQSLGTSLLSQYDGITTTDKLISINAHQEDAGANIGRTVTSIPAGIDRIETSPYLRTLQTLQLLIQGDPSLAKVPIFENSNIQEMNLGEAGNYPDARLYFADHIDEYSAFVRKNENYMYPGGENRRQWRKRMRKQAGQYGRNKSYNSKNTLVISHSLVIKKQIDLLTQPNWFERQMRRSKKDLSKNITIDPGSITILEEIAQNFFTRRRRYKVVTLNKNVSTKTS